MYSGFGRRASALYCGIWLLLLTGVLPGQASAQTSHDAQLWIQSVAIVALPDQWRLHLEGQPRWSQDVTELDHSLVRWALGYAVSRRVVLWAGHAWVPRTLGPDTRHEQRLWQQLSLTLPDTARWRHSLRIRLEQRFLDPWADSSHRLRTMARTVRPLGTSRWSLVLWDELKVNFDDTVQGPGDGFDRNRFFGGTSWQASRAVALESGYLLQTSGPSGARLQDHTALLLTNLTF
jgi:hypothetical protein